MTPFWLTLWAIAVALSWLLPNHYAPWFSFHADAWMALIFLAASAAVFAVNRHAVPVDSFSIVVALLAGVPWLQYAFGLVPQAGLAWIASIFLVGLLLATVVGALWERNDPGQIGDGLFLAIGLAGVVSVGIELYQWLQMGGLELWILVGGGARPYANLGQPNQLGTLLLWSILATAWGLARQRIGVWTALLMALFLLFGVALTASHTAWLGVALLIAASWYWRGVWPDRHLPWVAVVLGLYFVACVLLLGWVQQISQGNSVPTIGEVTRMSGELRPLAWAAFLDAAWRQPWFGYGWGQVAIAQMAVATAHPNLQYVFSYAHNLPIDMVLWCGIPLGLLVCATVAWWFWGILRSVRSAEDAILCMLLLVVGNHAMLEMPLYYGYFLFPAGLVVGVLNTRLSGKPQFQVGRWLGVVVWAVAATLLALIIRDYAKVETSYQTLQREWDHVVVSGSPNPPEVLILTQWADYIKYARMTPAPGMSPEDLNRLETVVVLHPNLLLFYKLALSLALNQQPEGAEQWLQRMCKSTGETECLAMQAYWKRQALEAPAMANIRWPE